MALNPRSNICIKSQINNKYLCLQTGTSQTYGLLQFSADNLFDPIVQIEVVKTDDTDLVHLKSRYNNKYLVRWEPNSNWISASGDYPNNDKSSWDCTFFKPILIEDDGQTKKLQFQHVQLGYYLTLGSEPFANYLYADPIKRDDVFDVVDWDSMLRFRKPRKVAFKDWTNTLYLAATMFNGRPYLQFSNIESTDPRAALEIIPSNDGMVYIKSTYFKKYCRLAGEDYEKIVVDVKDLETTYNKSLAMFRYIVVDINRIALISASSTRFCKRHDMQDQLFPNLLAAVELQFDQYTPLYVVDLEKKP